MTPLPDVIVVGGGAVGASCARALAHAGAAVTIVHRPDQDGDAWQASAGMLAAQIETGQDSPMLALAIAGRAFYERNAARLERDTGIDIGLTQPGILELAWTEAGASAMKERVAWQRQRGHHANWLDPDEVLDGWPWIGACRGAFWSPDDGAVVPERLVAALRSDAASHGAITIEDLIVGLDVQNGTLRGVVGEHARYRAGIVIIAAGAWSGRLEGLPRPLSVEPVRGQMLAFPWPEALDAAIVYGDNCYLLKRDGLMLIGATVEHAGFNLTPSVEPVVALQRRASAIYTRLIDQTPTRSWVGLRPGTPDGLPIMGPEPRLPGLWYATGHGRNGILLAGITGELLAREVGGEILDEQMEPFRPTRFWNW